ncbi:cortexillin-1-like [Varroa jacobsoni]|uniref:cortexillin-1-like n=1 Tax=Varroa jacobsoni TaxID=62625 RepID=UPI000BF89C92|nr:cortexillin-1-like [Varroa jacobsoni]
METASAPLPAKWVDIQQKTFTNWVNEQLKPTGEQVHDLRADLCNGLKLISLVEVLQNKAGGPGPSRGLRRIRNPLNQHQYLENVQVALNAIAADNVKLVNIGIGTGWQTGRGRRMAMRYGRIRSTITLFHR